MNPAAKQPRILIHGVSGRMGQALLRLGSARDDLSLVAAVSRSSPAQRIVGGVPHFASSELAGLPEFDVAIDFTLPPGFSTILALCCERGAALVSGTTGLDDARRHELQVASTRIPVIWAANFSLGVAVLAELVQRAATSLPGWDCDIVESHHVHKKDAPSGTALSLGSAAHEGGAHPRYASLRAGDIVGEHFVQFTGMGERLELNHRATDRDIFARGALHASTRLPGKAPGLYHLRDLLN